MNTRTVLLIVMLVAITGMILYLEDQSAAPSDLDSQQAQPSTEVKDGQFPKAAELTGLTGYINTDRNLTIASLKGKVVMVDFWTYSCVNCIRTLPFITEWDRKYRDKGLVIIGVHTPEFDFEKKRENVEMAIQRYNIEYPVVQDNNYETWRAYNNRYWPRKYLIDSEGFIRYDHIGEGAYEETEEIIQELLREIDQDVDEALSDIQDTTPTGTTTPELYAGSRFTVPKEQDLGNEGGLQIGTTYDYVLPDELDEDVIYLEGPWESTEEALLSEGASSIVLHFNGASVNIVATTSGEQVRMEVMVDGAPLTEDNAGYDVQFLDGSTYIIVDEPRLYNIYNGEATSAVLRLSVDSEDYSFNSFTFG